MEASQPQQPAPPPAPPPAAERAEKPGIAPRVLAVIGGLIWGVLGVALIVVGFEIIDAQLCSEPATAADIGEECYDGSSTQRVLDLLFGFPAGVLGIATAVLAVYFAATGRRGRLLLQIGLGALVLFGGSLLIGAF
jgi:hypothetical protein